MLTMKSWKSLNVVERLRFLAQNDVWKFKIALLLQNWRPAGFLKWLVETACLLESNIPYCPGRVGWQSGWELCLLFRWDNLFFYQFHKTWICQRPFSKLVRYHGYAHAKPQLDPYDEKKMNEPMVLVHGRWVEKMYIYIYLQKMSNQFWPCLESYKALDWWKLTSIEF